MASYQLFCGSLMIFLERERQGQTTFDPQWGDLAHAGRQIWQMFLLSDISDGHCCSDTCSKGWAHLYPCSVQASWKKAVRKNLADVTVCRQPLWSINSFCSLNKMAELGFFPLENNFPNRPKIRRQKIYSILRHHSNFSECSTLKSKVWTASFSGYFGQNASAYIW